MKFCDYEWHDATLKNIGIDRNKPGYADTIIMDIVWPDNSKAKVVFSGVYKAILNLNFGFIGTETIYSASILTDDDDDFVKLAEKWQNHILDIEKLNCYYIETATMMSQIKIIAEDFKVMNE